MIEFFLDSFLSTRALSAWLQNGRPSWVNSPIYVLVRTEYIDPFLTRSLWVALRSQKTTILARTSFKGEYWTNINTLFSPSTYAAYFHICVGLELRSCAVKLRRRFGGWTDKRINFQRVSLISFLRHLPRQDFWSNERAGVETNIQDAEELNVESNQK